MFCPNKAINLLPNVINEISFLIDFAYARPDENVILRMGLFNIIKLGRRRDFRRK